MDRRLSDAETDADGNGVEPLAQAFGRVAADYERARPEYPPEAIDLLQREFGVGQATRVCDLGAGTGKLTRMLAACGADVVAIEPVDGMREQLAAAVQDVEVMDGAAEAMPLPDGSVDVVTVAQAFHWFHYDAALREIDRVLRPGGGLAVLFNQRDERVPWVKAWSDAIGWHDRSVSSFQSTDWTKVLSDGGFFNVRYAAIEWAQPSTRDLLAARVRSVSYVAAEPEDGQRRYVDKVLALARDFDEPFDVPYVTRVWWCTKSS
jgi:ubiquinone/menaquinone biosynthesis C-methylase UbiE